MAMPLHRTYLALGGLWLTSQIALTTATATLVTATPRTICALGVDQKPRCWGSSGFGQTNPPDIAMTAIACGDYACCGLALNGVAQCWGDFSRGGQYSPIVSTPPDALSALARSIWHMCGIKQSDGKAICWGFDNVGKMGTPPNEELVAIAGDGSNCGVKASDNLLTCWGSQGGNSGYPSLSNVEVSTLYVDLYGWCGLRASDSKPLCVAYYSGNNGELPDPDVTMFEVITCNGYFACGVKQENRAALCWPRQYSDGYTWPFTYLEVEGPFQHLSCGGYGDFYGGVVGLRSDGFLQTFGGRTPSQSWLVQNQSTPCSAEDNCRQCRDGAFAALNSTERIVDGGGHCIVNQDGICVDVYTRQTCSNSTQGCPTDPTQNVQPHYLEPVWYQDCEQGRKIVMGPEGCNGRGNANGICAASR